jgi:hypothetical protein
MQPVGKTIVAMAVRGGVFSELSCRSAGEPVRFFYGLDRTSRDDAILGAKMVPLDMGT